MIIDFVRKHLVLDFSQLIGQEVVVRFLKNTLYKNYFFPLYLFSGPRGTGKTSSARLLATAYFCEKYHDFCHSKGDVIVPCHTCATCIETVKGKNPNLIEIDAASNTGVDNIRALIENAYLMPIDSNKKFYIIDEAHMLSKSAFNACLKIMEEPPEHVHFIMATTEPLKVIDTIRSRSIHLHFTPLSYEHLSNYLCTVAQQENVHLDHVGAYLISTVAEGSIRDALNMLTKLCIMYGSHITEEMIRKNCGVFSKNIIHTLIDTVLNNEHEKFITIIDELKNEVIDKKILFEEIINYVTSKTRENTRNLYNKDTLIIFMELLYRDERYFLESLSPFFILESWMYIIHNKNFSSQFDNQIAQTQQKASHNNYDSMLSQQEHAISDTSKIFNEVNKKEDKVLDEELIIRSSSQNNTVEDLFENKIDTFITALMNKEKAIGAILKTAVIQYDSSVNSIHCYFDAHVSFYLEFINNKMDVIKPILQAFFDPTITLKCSILTKPREKKNEEKEHVAQPKAPHATGESGAISNAFNNAQVVTNHEKKAHFQPSNSSGISKYGFIKKKVMPTVFAKGSLGEEIVKTFPGVTYEEKNNIK